MKRTLVEMSALAVCSFTLMCLNVSLTPWSKYGLALASLWSDVVSRDENYLIKL